MKMDNLVAIFDIFSCLFYFILLVFLIFYRKKFITSTVFIYLGIIAFLMIFISFGNYLEWKGITDILDLIGDYTLANVYILFLFLVHTIITEEMGKESLQKNREIAILNEISHLIIGEFNLDIILKNSLELILKLVNFEIGGIYLIEEGGKYRRLKAEVGFSKEKNIGKLEKVETLRGIAGEAIKTKKIISMKISDYKDTELKKFLEEEGVKYLVSVPLITKDKPVGAINLCSKKEIKLEKETLFMLELISNHLASAIENIGLYKDLQEAYDNLIETQEQLIQTESLAKIARLSTSIAHEIRNPLSAINTAVDVLKEELKLKEEDEKLFNIIQKETKRLNEIITDFLQFARLKEPDFRKIEIVDLLDSILLLMEKEIPSNIKIEKNYREKKCEIIADPDLLKSVFYNIILNSIQAIDKKIDGIIKIDFQEDEKYCKIYITDNGCGIKKEDIEKIFEPFYSTKKEGTGMGLAIVANIVLKHKGKINVESEKNKTTFEIVFPKEQNK
jgi:nitrogen-specific signal transduction histidine kinase